MRRLILLAGLALPLLPLTGHAQTSPPPAAADPGDSASETGGHHKFQAKFAAANTAHDGHLTLAQAQAAGLTPVTANFAAIDTRNRGYVTFNDIMAWRLDQKAKQMEQQAATLRATD